MLEKGIFVLLANTMGSPIWSICQQSSGCWDSPAVPPVSPVVFLIEEGLARLSG